MPLKNDIVQYIYMFDDFISKHPAHIKQHKCPLKAPARLFVDSYIVCRVVTTPLICLLSDTGPRGAQPPTPLLTPSYEQKRFSTTAPLWVFQPPPQVQSLK